MRLLHADKLEFEEFFDTQIPPYLILSHRWGEKEVTYKQMNKKRAEEGPGLIKILKFCKLALENRYTWIWIDTCCIDKKSSAELSEAINSMFKWYQSAEECVVYLSDLSLGDHKVHNQDFQTRFSASSWFTRGWTLQELLAPRQLTFYDTDWKEIGGKDLLCGLISTTTGVDECFIAQDHNPPLRLDLGSVAMRMSWAAKRKTSRSEDMAYCLLGIFDVNMPLLYGEGAEMAFLRLQTEIIKDSDDETIFAWTANLPILGILAKDPSFFVDSGAIQKAPIFGYGELRYWMTNKGLALHIPNDDWPADASNRAGTVISIPIYVQRHGNRDLGIQIQRMNTRNIWCRTMCQSLSLVPKRNRTLTQSHIKQVSHVIYINTGPSENYSYKL
ncbi:MAG: hypothetical protein LQ337_002419 [Flavoplaca oasis]|nr:MAG: hypothetical protein LQ337_002419 [Flavoplaca oasis]